MQSPKGLRKSVEVADTPLLEVPGTPPIPAIVLIVPSKAIFRMQELLVSAKYTMPVLSTQISTGLRKLAEVAGPPSPENPAVPVPAIVAIFPVDAVIFRMRLLP